MRQAHRKVLATVMLTGGALAMAGYAHADSNAEGGAAGSPGVLTGNVAQVPVDVPVIACGNTVNVVGLLNPAMGNSCAHASHSVPRPHRQRVPLTGSDSNEPPDPAGPADPAEPATRLAETGSAPVAVALPSGAALLLAGVVLYRRPRRSRRSYPQEPGGSA
ncbi:chaplin [Streptomyces sp. NPDC052236]|uniref:chaplin n=1 Tax=Streptomyces sp. NPDC052236 TaxID=3365686 RepID=UPI0037D4DD86